MRALACVGVLCFGAGWAGRGLYEVYITFLPSRARLGASEARWLLNGRRAG